jgi:hypothetical protein
MHPKTLQTKLQNSVKCVCVCSNLFLQKKIDFRNEKTLGCAVFFNWAIPNIMLKVKSFFER